MCKMLMKPFKKNGGCSILKYQHQTSILNKFIFSLIVFLTVNGFSQEIASLTFIDKFNDYYTGGELDLIASEDSLLFVVQRIA